MPIGDIHPDARWHDAIGWYFPATPPSVPPTLEDALHAVRVEAAVCQMREFPMFGSDVLNIMAKNGLCDEAQALAAASDARAKVERAIAEEEIQSAAPSELEGPPSDHPASS